MSIPFLHSRYLNREVRLDELDRIPDDELRLLATEVDGLSAETSASIGRAMSEGRDYGVAEKLHRVAGRFSFAIDREQTDRQRRDSFLELHNQLTSVTAERDALRRQLDHLLMNRA